MVSEDGDRVEVQVSSDAGNGHHWPDVPRREPVLFFPQRRKILNPLQDPGAIPVFLDYEDSIGRCQLTAARHLQEGDVISWEQWKKA